MYDETQVNKLEYERKMIKASYDTMDWLSPSQEVADKMEDITPSEFLTDLKEVCKPIKSSLKSSKT